MPPSYLVRSGAGPTRGEGGAEDGSAGPAEAAKHDRLFRFVFAAGGGGSEERGGLTGVTPIADAVSGMTSPATVAITASSCTIWRESFLLVQPTVGCGSGGVVVDSKERR